MSWLNFNDSLNNLKGQLSNFASGVLADGDTNETGLTTRDQKYEDLEQLIANQAAEIVALRKENAELYNKGGVAQNGHSKTNKDEWSWDPPDTSQPNQQNLPPDNSDIIKNLEQRIVELEHEKKELNISLEQLDMDCQQTTEKVITLKDLLQREYDDLKIEYTNVLEERDNLLRDDTEKNKSIQLLQTEKANLLKMLRELKKMKQTDYVEDSKQRIQELENMNSKLKRDMEEILNNYKAIENELNEQKNQNKSDGVENTALLKQIEDLIVKQKEYEVSRINNQKEYEKLASILQGYEEQVRNYKNQCELLQKENEKLIENEIKIVQELTALKQTLDKTKNETLTINEEIQEKYVHLLTDSFKKFMDYPLVIENNIRSEDTFMATVEVIMKLLLDLKWKTETLKKELDDMTEEKTKILTEKNHEINKLLQNSEILSQEVITKSQALKNYEEENMELIKNNDNLINQLEMYKFNTRGLHTISESNEDNLLILETQLEKSNRKVKELEMTISDLENSKQESTDEVQTELEYIKRQLNITGTELSQTKNKFQTLQEKYQKIKLDYTNLQDAFDEVKKSYDKCFNEKETLNDEVGKIQSDFENTEYKFSEMNMSMETLKEETETLKDEIDSLTKSNKKLEILNLNYESKNELIENEVDDLKQQLTSEIDLREQQEIQIRSLSEKLQNAKMSETYFKLQNDTLHKELQSITESKQILNSKYETLTQNFKEMENYLKKYEEENLNLAEKCREIDELKLANQEMKIGLGKLADIQKNNKELSDKLKLSQNEVLRLQEENENIKVNAVTLDLQEYENKISTFEKENAELKKQLSNLNQQLLNLSNDKQNLSSEFDLVNKSLLENSSIVTEYAQRINELENNIKELNTSRNEMLNYLNVKHHESVQYHNEIQRLNQVLAVETEKATKYEEHLKNVESAKTEHTDNEKLLELERSIEKMKEEQEKLSDQNEFLRKKSELLAQNLLEEQSKVQQVIAEKNNAFSEKEISLSKELARLRAHLLEVQEAHTEEIVQADHKIKEMKAKVNEIEKREKESSTHYTSVNIRANQHLETLQNQLQMVTNQKDELQKKLSDADVQISKQSAALTNLEFVLEQFRKDKEKDIYHETERIRKQIAIEKQKQEELQTEISNLKSQLTESKQGLLAASRLSNQVESSKQQVASMKEEVTKLEEKLKKSEEKYNSLINQTDAKVDKMLIKNLIVGFISSNNNLNKDQLQILKIIATVLDFSQEDNQKVNLNRPNQGGTWLNSILHPQSMNRGPEMSQESLSQAFVRFLENESKPRQLPNLLETAPLDTNKSQINLGNEKPILLSQIVLPTFADFGQTRNSSSILKDVLKDNN